MKEGRRNEGNISMLLIQIYSAYYSFCYHLVRNLVQRLKTNRFFGVHTSYVIPSGTPVFLLCCLFPIFLLSDSFSRSFYTFKQNIGGITVRSITPETKATNKGLAFIGINYCKTEEEGIIAGQSRKARLKEESVILPLEFVKSKL
jgi:hypothetical protein